MIGGVKAIALRERVLAMPLAGGFAAMPQLGLPEAGYATAATVVGLENVLDQGEGRQARWARQRGRV
ncbi:hypothetical protein [Nocardia violaceofusca]|uniref:hypothetical protein n=1 Tax=Nocardia violaceofusca TaxID=941182 RepID=UPI0007A4A380|nr:hypothetical protein [Nocardia violaceofusca]